MSLKSTAHPTKTMIEVYGNNLSNCLTAATNATLQKDDIGGIALRYVYLALVIEAGDPQSIGTLVVAATDGKVLVEHRLFAQIHSSEGIFTPDAPTDETVIWQLCLDVRQAKAMAKALKRKTSEISKKPGDMLDIRVGAAASGALSTPRGLDLFVSGSAGDWAAVEEDSVHHGQVFPSYTAALTESDATDTRHNVISIKNQIRLMKAMEPGFGVHHHAVVTHKTMSDVYVPLTHRGPLQSKIRTRGLIMHVSLP